METSNQAEPKKSNTGLMIGIGVIAIVVLLCCCAVVVIATLTVMGPAVGRVFSSINNSLMTPNFPDDFPPPAFDLTQTPSDLVPQGGNADEIVRVQAWGFVLISAALDGCSYNPEASQTRIEVTQEADSSGTWKEEWTLPCDDGFQKAYTVTFAPTAGGEIDINVTSGE